MRQNFLKNKNLLIGLATLIAIRKINQILNKQLDTSSKKYYYYTYLKSILSYSLLPLLLVQGKLVYKNTPMFKPPTDNTHGIIKAESSEKQQLEENIDENKQQKIFRMLFLGESPIAGIGLKSHKEGAARQTAIWLSKKESFMGIDIEYDSFGINGQNIKETLRNSLPKVDAMKYDAIVLAESVNDSIGLTYLPDFKKDTKSVIEKLLNQNKNIKVYVCNPPPLKNFRNMPQPLRQTIGFRGDLVEFKLKELCQEFPKDRVIYAYAKFDTYSRHLFCEDHFHPSLDGHIMWGQQLGKYIEP